MEQSDQEVENGNEGANQNGGGTSTPLKRKRRTLNQQERIIYAPACNLGTMHLDHTSGFITIPKEYVKFTKMNEQQNEEDLQQGIKIMRNMQNLTQSMNDRLKERDGEF